MYTIMDRSAAQVRDLQNGWEAYAKTLAEDMFQNKVDQLIIKDMNKGRDINDIADSYDVDISYILNLTEKEKPE